MISDPLYQFQTYLSGQYDIGVHTFGDFSPVLNIEPVWQDYKGKGVNIAFTRPVDRLHPELIANYDTSQLSLYDPLDDIVVNSNGYGTALAGLAAADDNGEGIVGTAPDANIQSTEGILAGTADIIVALADFDGMYGTHALEPFKNGRNGLGEIIVTTSPGDGHFYILGHIAGTLNSEFGLTSQRNVITVEGLTAIGSTANFPSSIAGGDMTLVSVMTDTASFLPLGSPDVYDPSSPYYLPPELRTPDLSGLDSAEDVTKTLTLDPRGELGFNNSTNGVWELLVGLYAEGRLAPFEVSPNAKIENSGDYQVMDDPQLTAGVAGGLFALILEANPDLGWRDVQEILAYSAQQKGLIKHALVDNLSPDDAWRENDATTWNAGGLLHNAKYGFGAIDIRAAVRLAETWDSSNSWSNEETLSATADFSLAQGGDELVLYDGFFSPVISKEYNFTVSDSFEIEHVELNLRYTTPGFDSQFDDTDALRYYDHAQAKIELVSPTGLVSTLSGHGEAYFGFLDWVDHGFTSRVFWGSDAAIGDGNWTVRFTNDSFSDLELTITEMDLTFYGKAADEDDRYIFTNDFNTVAELGRVLAIDDGLGKNEINAAPVLANLELTTAAGETGTADGETLYTLSDDSVINSLISGDGDDTLLGTSRGEVFHAGRGDDTISAGAGNDVITSGRGDDYINGGGGGDQARFEYALSAYSISTDAAGFTTLRNFASGFLETDVTVNVEYFRFADGTRSFDELMVAASNGAADALYFFNSSSRAIGQIAMPENEWSALGRAGTGWQAVGLGDVDGDGAKDVIWFNTASKSVGRFDIEIDGSVAWRGIGTAGGTWQVAGTADFDGDGDQDILWANTAQNSAGFYEMQNGSASWLNLGATGNNWEIVGTGDFNGDGRDDVLWYNTASGRVGQFQMAADGSKSWAAISTLGGGWRVAGTGDFDGDLSDDILVFQASSGRVGQFSMNGGTAAWESIGRAGAGWSVEGAGDFNGDGLDDVLWRNASTDQIGQFRMNGSGYEWESITTAGSDWDILI